MADKTPKVVQVEPNPFGDFTEEQLSGDPSKPDRFYLKGYSDKRHERELLIREKNLGKQGVEIPTMPRRFQYVSVQRPDTLERKDKVVEWQAKGYRIVQFDELEALGIDVGGSTVTRGTDGSVRVDSQMLMVIDAPGASRIYKEQQAATRALEASVPVRMNEAAERYNTKHERTTATGTNFEFVTE